MPLFGKCLARSLNVECMMMCVVLILYLFTLGVSLSFYAVSPVALSFDSRAAVLHRCHRRHYLCHCTLDCVLSGSVVSLAFTLHVRR